MIDRCNQIRAQIGLYLDDELRYGERDEFEAHVQNCAPCREIFDQERLLLEGVRASRPLYEASPELRERVAQIVGAESEPVVAPHKLRDRIQRIIQPSYASFFNFSPRRAIGLSLVLLAITLAGFWLLKSRRELNHLTHPSDFALMAVDTHLRRLRGNLPLEIVSDSPDLISNWFTGKVSFSLKLPNYQDSSGQEKLYHLEGARLVAFNTDYAAYIAYKMRQRPITLVVTSNSVAMPSGGEEQIVSNKLRFHYDSISGLKVITWADRGLTYALVSDLEERGQQSCMVCHAGTKDRSFIEGLKLSRAER
jgi:anti-sigma factor RsiW